MQKIINFDDLTKENIEEKFEYPRRSGSGKTNLLFNLISHQPDIDKMCLICWRSIWRKV